MTFIDTIKTKAKKNIKTIVLPEATDIRILQATQTILKEEFANIVLLGNKETINSIAKQNNLDISKAKIIEPCKSEFYDRYVKEFYEMRKEKGVTLETAKETILNPVYFGMMMVKDSECDGLVSGAIHSTADTLRPALQILKAKPESKLVSAFFIMVLPDEQFGADGVFIFSDCGLNPNPDKDQLAQIALSSANSFSNLVEKTPKIAMLSYSTYGSAKSDSCQKVIDAVNLVKEQSPELIIDGEVQLDVALVPEIANIKAPGSILQGKANVLVFPNLDAGNIGYKLVQRLAKAEAYGPLCQGISKPVNDLSRGCSAEDIVGVVAITAIQATM